MIFIILLNNFKAKRYMESRDYRFRGTMFEESDAVIVPFLEEK